MKRPCSSFLVAISLVATCIAVRGQTNTIIIPPEAETQLGDPNYGGANLFFQTREVEVLFASTDCEKAPSDRLHVTEIAFRVHGGSGVQWDAIVTNLFIQMDTVKPGDRTNATWMLHPRSVYFANLTHFSGRAGMTNAFDIRLPLNVPYIFDRSRGQLALGIHSAGIRAIAMSMDAFFSIDGGYHYYEPFPPGKLVGHPEEPATKLTFQPVFAQIDSITIDPDHNLVLEFSTFADVRSPVLESSIHPEGPFETDASAETVLHEDRTGRAKLTLGGTDRMRFYRLRFDR